MRPFDADGIPVDETCGAAFVPEEPFTGSAIARGQQLHMAGIEVFPFEDRLVQGLVDLFPTQPERFPAARMHQFIGARYPLRDLPQGLGGQRTIVDPGTADLIPFHQQYMFAEVEGAHRGGITSRAATDDAEIVMFHCWTLPVC